ncbi:hypothetical protein GE061_019270 [Apolygus lucorum]|uniref:MD-2-related lipid-recognition domain-containing protein n=1 Tax=Apolygus lucorum TaxID=248454 RepID=A0A6A4JWK9_APOLU|nr:hypothetical protein GE061_019270 [Apolygus lucorum]
MLTLHVLLLCCISTLLVQAGPKSRKAVDILKAIKFGNCDDAQAQGKKADYSYFTNITINNVGRGRDVINGQFVNMYPAKKTTAPYKLWSCKSELESDCELFGTYSHDDYCATAVEKGQFYSGVYLAFHPPLACPLKKNMVHEIQNASLDAEAVMKLGSIIPGFKTFHWLTKTKMIALPERKEFGCVKMMFKIAQIRV